MKKLLLSWLLLCSSVAATAKEVTYEGTWLTTNRKLDGPITCVVTDVGDNNWRGHFYGVWQGVEFSYKVNFTVPPERLRGKAVIDGANYEWTGEMCQGAAGRFKGTFWGDRYFGSFTLRQKANPPTSPSRGKGAAVGPEKEL
jgi:hypothetical protein